ncbi:MAG: hypothetical protein ACQEW9_00450 [Bacteroidota bacterium]|uniref:NVEALA protein n=1 Tax=Algoriphagus faecimaris TaxID=686796 RepID=A0A1G6XD83_9BACT|nr:hypothetical protein [Algoriphagus faecimaris]SDD75196.1 hypothetical protein SAMN04488104_10548 [Algoriphagus faecimaris]
MKKLIASLSILISLGSLSNLGAQSSVEGPGGNPCDAGPDKNFEQCRDKNCTELLNVGCTFTYDKDVLTIWGRREG